MAYDFKESAIDPAHYKDLSPEPIDVIEGWGLDYHLGSALKYIARAGNKEGNPRDQDLRKAVWFLQRYISLIDTVTPAGGVWRQEDVLGS